MQRRILVPASVLVLMGMCLVGTARAQSPLDKSVFFTFSQPVTLPNVTLPAGRYLFQLTSSVANRNTVEVFSADRSKPYGFFMTVPDQRVDIPKNAEVRFMETSADMPPAIRTWWYPGTQVGWEFIYPKSQAVKLARTAKEPVLTTASVSNATTADQMKNAPLARVDSAGSFTTVGTSETTASEPVTGTAAEGQVADNTVAQNTSPATAMSSSTNASNTTRTALPKTASDMPLMALAGFLMLAAGFGLGIRRRQSAL